jgi:hypothetical protein
MNPLPPEMLPPVQHVIFGIFNLAVPNILAWIIVVMVLFIAAWVRLPKIFEPAESGLKGGRDESYT